MCDATVLIVNYNSGRWLKRCLEHLRTALPVRILDNASSDDSLDGIVPGKNVELIRSDTNLGFAAGVNRLAGGVTTPFMLILNPDCAVAQDAVEHLASRLKADASLGLVSGRVEDLSGREQRGSRRCLPTPVRIVNELIPSRRKRGLGVDLTEIPPPPEFAEIEAVSGACMLLRTEAFRAVGGTDAGFPLHFEDLDLMARLRRAGWRIGWEPAARITHAGGVSSGHRRFQVHWNRHRGLWRYLRIHCRTFPWTPVWWLLIWSHAVIKLPLIGWRR